MILIRWDGTDSYVNHCRIFEAFTDKIFAWLITLLFETNEVFFNGNILKSYCVDQVAKNRTVIPKRLC